MNLEKNFFLQILGGRSLICHGLYGVRTHVLLVLVCNFLYCWEVLFRRVEVVDCYLIHCDIHYWAMASMTVMPVEIRLSDIRYAVVALNSEHATAVFLFDLFARLENRW